MPILPVLRPSILPVAVMVTLSLVMSGLVEGHAPGENYVFLDLREDASLTGRFEFSVNDLKSYGMIGEVAEDAEAANILAAAEEFTDEVGAYIGERFLLSVDDTPVELIFTKRDVLEELSGFVQYHFEAKLPKVPRFLTVRHEMMYERDQDHRGLVVLSYNPVTGKDYGEEWVAMILNREKATQTMDLREGIDNLVAERQAAKMAARALTGKVAIRRGFTSFLLDLGRVLLVLLLLAPMMLRKSGEDLVPEESPAPILRPAMVAVAAVALALVIGLALAGLERLVVSAGLAGAVAAAALLLIALNNFSLFLPRAGLAAIGAVAGFAQGFLLAIPIVETPLGAKKVAKVVGGYSVGALAALAALSLAAAVVLFALRRRPFYQGMIMRGGAAVGALVATYLFVQRAFDL